MKSFLFIVETHKSGSHILFEYPIQQNWEAHLQLGESETGEPQIITKEKIKKFLTENEYFGQVNVNNIHGFTSSFLSDFLAPTKNMCSREIFIDDLFMVTSSITFKDCKQQHKNQAHIVTAFNLVLVCNDSKYITYQKKALTYLAKALELQEHLSGYLSQQISKVQESNIEFEKRLNQIPSEVEKIKLSLQDVPKKLNEIIKTTAYNEMMNIELFNTFKTFFVSVVNQEEIKINHFTQSFPSAEMMLNPISIQIKPYQTIIMKKEKNKTYQNITKGLRFQKFLQLMNPYKSFHQISSMFNIPFSEIQLYVEHLVIHNKGIIMNKICNDSVFILNPNFKFQLDKQAVRLSDQFFTTYKMDFLSVVVPFNKPQKQIQICQEIAGFERKHILLLVVQQVIQECDVYLYLKDPFVTKEEFLMGRKKSFGSGSKDLLEASYFKDSNKEEEYDILLLKKISNHIRVSLQELAQFFKKDTSFIWHFVQKYEEYIGYYFLL